MRIYLIKNCNAEDFKKAAKKDVKTQEIEYFTKTSDVYSVKERSQAIKECRKYNRIYKYNCIYYFTEIKLY